MFFVSFASTRTNKLKDDKEKGGENEITYLFSATDNENLHNGVYNKHGKPDFWKIICQAMRGNMRSKKRLPMAERTKFMSMKEETDEPIKNIYTVYEMQVDIVILKNLEKKNRRLA